MSVVIEVKGGFVQAVYSELDHVFIIDYDTYSQECDELSFMHCEPISEELARQINIAEMKLGRDKK